MVPPALSSCAPIGFVDPIRWPEPELQPWLSREPRPTLMQESLAGDGFADHPDPETEHGGAAVEEFHPLQLFLVDLGGSLGFVPGELAGLLEAGCLALGPPAPSRRRPWPGRRGALRLGDSDAGDRVDPRQDIPWFRAQHPRIPAIPLVFLPCRLLKAAPWGC